MFFRAFSVPDSQAHNLKAAGSNPAPATNKTLPKPPFAVAFAFAAPIAKSNIEASAPWSVTLASPRVAPGAGLPPEKWSSLRYGF